MHAKRYATIPILYNTVQGTHEKLSIVVDRFIQNKLGVICFLKNSATVLYISHC
jgi:hypothetical protein